MRVLLTAGLLVSLGAARADDPASARAVVDRAINQIGGEEKLRELKGGVGKTSGVFQGRQSRAEFRGELPGKFRIDSTRVVDGNPVRVSRIVDGEKGRRFKHVSLFRTVGAF